MLVALTASFNIYPRTHFQFLLGMQKMQEIQCYSNEKKGKVTEEWGGHARGIRAFYLVLEFLEFMGLNQQWESLLCNQLMSMQQNQVHSVGSYKYAKISLEKRMELASLVLEESLSISKSAKKVGIKLSTAKLIMKKYREEGTFFESRKDKKNRLQNRETQLKALIEHSSSPLQNDRDYAKDNTCSLSSCYYLSFLPGMLYFPQPCLSFMPAYQ